MTAYPTFALTGQVALVTGAARGIGRSIALALANAGADVALGLRDSDTGADLADEIRAMGRRAVRLPMDVRRLDQVRAAVEETVAQLGRLDLLVNNAGLGPSNPAEAVTEEDFDLTLDVNVKGLFFASQAAGRVMIAPGSGRIINLSSQAGFVALPTRVGLLHDQGRGRPPDQVPGGRVGASRHHGQRGRADVHPDAGHRARPRGPGFRADVDERIAGLHRIGEPMDVAGAVVYLASPAASLVTGTHAPRRRRLDRR